MVTQSSKQSQNQIIQNKKSVSDFHNSCSVKERKEFKKLRNHNVIWKIMRTPVLEFLIDINID